MLTVRYDRLGVRAGDRVLDLGTGGGRHAYEAMRRGASVVAVDTSAAEVKDVRALMNVMEQGDEATGSTGGRGSATVGDARRLPFPRACFDRVIAAEVLEHIPEDGVALVELARVLRPGGTIAVTVPRWGPELVNWALSDEYHETPGGHVRIYRRSTLQRRLAAAGLVVTGHHHAHALHSPYWWLRSAVGVERDDHPLVRAYHRLLVWDITAGTPLTRLPEAALNPLLGKSVVVYATKPA
ncbi:MAG: class I SAM-dependent methyltransferase [Acidimicrobiales bacterium]